jgi:hypothetical protein
MAREQNLSLAVEVMATRIWKHLFILVEVEFYLRSRGCVVDLYLKQSVIPLAHSSGLYWNRELLGLCSSSGGLI